MNGFNNDPLQTISAAAMAITAAENRVPHASAQKKRWGSFWRLCFGSNKHKQRIGHAILSPVTSAPGTDPPSTEMPPQQHSLVFPFIAPPSSPASFLQSDPPSCTQSPSVSLSLKSPSMFTVGPYAHEPQLVSPPVFSTFTTEPSTAPFTPPPESRQLTTPSSPEVPFARLSYHNSEYEYQSHQLGSGTSSPFRNGVIYKWGSHQGSGTLTPDSATPRGSLYNKYRNSETLYDPRVSFEITAEDVVRCMAKEPSLAKALSSEIADYSFEKSSSSEGRTQHMTRRSTTLDSIMEFNFGNTDVETSVGSSKEWSFFPMIQSGVN